MQNKPEPVVGKRIGFLGNLSHKKGIELLIHSFNAIHKFDPEFQLFIGGNIQDQRYACYLDYCIPRLKLQDVIHYYGFVEDVEEWFKNVDWLLITSPLEGCPVGALEGLKYGKTPIFYDFFNASDLYPSSFIWKDFTELIEIIKKGPQDPKIFQDFVSENYSKEKQFQQIDKIVEDLLSDVPIQKEEKKKSTIAAVMAVHNGEKGIKKSLNSLLKQTKPLNRIVVVNDASTDNTLNIVNKIKDTSEIPIEVITNPTNKWVFASRNIGADACSEDYLMFLDHDDLVEQNYCVECSKILDENSAISIVYSDIVYFNPQTNDTKEFKQPDFNPQLLAQQNFICYSSMQRTKSFKEIGGFSEYLNDTRNHMSEWDLWLRYAQKGYSFKHLPKPLFHYSHSVNSDQMSQTQERSRDDQSLELALSISNYDYDNIQMHGDKKKIVLVVQGRDYLDRSKVGFELMQVYQPLTEFGDVYTFQYDVEQKYFGRTEMQNRLKRFINMIKPDYVFHFSYKADILPATWKEISEKYNTIVWNSDDDRRHNNFTKDYNENFRYCITTYSKIYDIMMHPGKILSQWAANQHYFKPSNEKTIDVSFVGQRYGDREEMLKGLNVEIYGSGWPNGFVDFKKMTKIITQSKISINFSKGGNGEKQLKLRSFEICASNTLCLCENVKGIEEYYEPDEEIVLFDNKEELEEKIKYYLSHEEERKKIAQAGYERTIEEHKWSDRLNDIFNIIDKKENKK